MKGIVSSNSLLKQVEAQIEQGLKAGVRENYMRVVIAGMKFALKDGPNGILAKLKSSKDPVADIVKGAISVVGLLRRAAKGAMPGGAMVPAAMTLTLHGLDYAERIGILKVDKAVVDQATQLFAETMLVVMGVSKDQLNKMTNKVHGLMQDPAQMAKLQQAPEPSQLHPRGVR